MQVTQTRREVPVKLTAVQAEHVAKVFPEYRAEMQQYLATGARVVICRQNECGEVPPYAITVEGTAFWIDCCDTQDEAQTLAESLGLTVVGRGQHGVRQ